MIFFPNCQKQIIFFTCLESIAIPLKLSNLGLFVIFLMTILYKVLIFTRNDFCFFFNFFIISLSEV